MKEIKIICDKCGRTISEEDVIEFHTRACGNFKLDLCEKCSWDLIKHIGTWVKEK